MDGEPEPLAVKRELVHDTDRAAAAGDLDRPVAPANCASKRDASGAAHLRADVVGYRGPFLRRAGGAEPEGDLGAARPRLGRRLAQRQGEIVGVAVVVDAARAPRGDRHADRACPYGHPLMRCAVQEGCLVRPLGSGHRPDRDGSEGLGVLVEEGRAHGRGILLSFPAAQPAVEHRVYRAGVDRGGTRGHVHRLRAGRER